jgi:hypothetical protein
MFCQFFIKSELKVQICPGSLICPEMDFQQHPQLAVTITSSLFIGFERMTNEWKVEEVNYEFSIVSFLRMQLD